MEDTAGFDPDSFLAKLNAPAAPTPAPAEAKPAAGGFDPDAFLARLPEAEPAKEKPSFLSRVGESFSNLGSVAKKAALGAVDLASPVSKAGGLQVPFGQLAEPSYRRELVRGVSDVVTGGYAEKIANADFEPPSWLPKGEFGVTPKGSRESFAASAVTDAKRSPDARALGNVTGSFLPSPARWLGKQAAAVVPGTGALATTARGLAAYEAQAIPMAAALAPEGERLEAILSAATDPAGLALSAAPGAVQAVKKPIKGFAARAEDRAIYKALEDIEEGAGKKAKAGWREAGKRGATERGVRDNPELRRSITSHPDPKTDAKLREVAESVARRGGKTLGEFYESADARSEVLAPPVPTPREVRQLGPIPGDAPDVPGAARPPTRAGAKLLGAADDVEPVVPAPDRAYHADQNARAAEIRADKAEAALARHAAAGEPVNPEMAATYSRRQAVREVAATELRNRANELRAQAEAVAGDNVPPGGRPDTDLPQIREVTSKPLGESGPTVRKYVPADYFHAMEFENVKDPTRTVIVTGSTKTPGKWQTTHFDERGPSGDVQSASPADALKDLHPSQWRPKTQPPRAPVTGEYIPPETPGTPAATAPRTQTVAGRPVEPKPRPPGASVGDATKNMDRDIASLERGTVEDRLTAKHLRTIRDEFHEAYGEDFDTVIPSKALRAEQSAYQKQGYGKAIPGTPDENVTNAKILANRIASKAVGDVVVKHVTGMSYKDARIAAAKDPKSDVGRYMRANDDVMVANRIQALVDSRKGSNLGAPHRATQIANRLLQGLAPAAGVTAITSVLGSEAGALAGAAYGAAKLPKYIRRGADAVAPLAVRATEAASRMPVKAAGVARLIQAGRAGASREKLRQMAAEAGVPPEDADKIADSNGL